MEGIVLWYPLVVLLTRYGHEILSEETGGRAPFFSRLGYGGNRSPEPFGLESFDPEPFGLELMAERLTTEGLMAERPVEGNAEGARLPRKQGAEKTSP
jgi:hypothetical protein